METLTKPAQAELEDVLHHFLMLSERWNEDRQDMAKQNAELGKLVVRLSAQIEKLKEADKELRVQLSQSIDKATLTMAEKTAEGFKQKVMKDVESAARELKKTSEDTSQQLCELHENYRYDRLIARTAFLILPIIVSLLIFWWLSPKPMLALTDQQMSIYQDGKLLESVWPKLNPKQRNWLIGLAEGKIINRGKALDER